MRRDRAAAGRAGQRPRRNQRRRRRGSHAHREGPHRPRDVLDALLAQILERIGQPVADLVAHDARHAKAARLGQAFEPRRDIHSVAEDVVAVDDDVAEIDPDPEVDAPVFGDFGIAVDHRPLDLDGAADRIDDAGKLDQHAVAGGLDDAAAMLGDLRVGKLASMGFEPRQRSFLVCSHQPRVAGRIGGEDRGETAFDRLSHRPSPRPRRSQHSRNHPLRNGHARVRSAAILCDKDGWYLYTRYHLTVLARRRLDC